MEKFNQTPEPEKPKERLGERIKRIGGSVIKSYLDNPSYMGYPLAAHGFTPPIVPEYFQPENERPYDPELDDEDNIERGRE